MTSNFRKAIAHKGKGRSLTLSLEATPAHAPAGYQECDRLD
ncbi:hypothetical protein [Leptolyngbya sp. 'hensonii']|nr:hypothetical protein [Leptolyngbya sp. 'hensonii']